jgi:hypothetical protein
MASSTHFPSRSVTIQTVLAPYPGWILARLPPVVIWISEVFVRLSKECQAQPSFIISQRYRKSADEIGPIIACILLTRQVINGFRIWQLDLFGLFTLRSYSYLLHNFAPHKLKTLFSLSWIVLSNPFSCGILSSAVSQYLSSSNTFLLCARRRILYCTRSVS